MKNPKLKKLKNLRTLLGITSNAMARELKISKTMYLYIENGKRRLSYDMAIKIATFFRMKPDEIFLEDTRKFLVNSHI